MKEQEKNQQNNTKLEKKPNEKSGVVVSSHIKIYDPNTKEVLVQQRAS
jgi:hypothetical protein